MQVLFLCTGNSCRSIFAEAIFNHLAPKNWHATSAGSHPTGEVHPQTIHTLQKMGIITDYLRSKSLADISTHPDIVITVCSGVAGEVCPAYLGSAIRCHWDTEDPSHVFGTETDIEEAFIRCYRTLTIRITEMLKLPLEELQKDKVKLKASLNQIALLTTDNERK